LRALQVVADTFSDDIERGLRQLDVVYSGITPYGGKTEQRPDSMLRLFLAAMKSGHLAREASRARG